MDPSGEWQNLVVGQVVDGRLVIYPEPLVDPTPARAISVDEFLRPTLRSG